jgi:hypothetical protein
MQLLNVTIKKAMVLFDWLMVQLPMKDVLKCSLAGVGTQYATATGI